MTEIVTRHLRDLEVHHVDLDAGYTPSDWPAEFVEFELAKRLRDLDRRADRAALLAWLLGRCPAPELGPCKRYKCPMRQFDYRHGGDRRCQLFRT